MTFPTIDPRGLFGTPKADTRLHMSSTGGVAIDRFDSSRSFGMDSAYAGPWHQAHSDAIDRLIKQLYKRTRYKTPSRDRTTSFKKRAGSRKGNGRRTTLKDRGWEVDWDSFDRPWG